MVHYMHKLIHCGMWAVAKARYKVFRKYNMITPHNEKVKLLKNDNINGLYHVFGSHDKYGRHVRTKNSTVFLLIIFFCHACIES